MWIGSLAFRYLKELLRAQKTVRILNGACWKSLADCLE